MPVIPALSLRCLPALLPGRDVLPFLINDTLQPGFAYGFPTHGKTVDWERIEGYFALFDGEVLFAALKEKYRG